MQYTAHCHQQNQPNHEQRCYWILLSVDTRTAIPLETIISMKNERTMLFNDANFKNTKSPLPITLYWLIVRINFQKQQRH